MTTPLTTIWKKEETPSIKEAKKQGIEVIVVDAQDDSAKQTNDVEDLLQQGVDALLINPADSSAISTAVQSANSLGIPVVTLDRSDPEPRSLVADAPGTPSSSATFAPLPSCCTIKSAAICPPFTLSEATSVSTFPFSAERSRVTTKVAELEGVPGASATRERGSGFHKTADDKLNVIAKQTADFDRTKGLNVMENLLQGNPDIQAVFAHNDELLWRWPKKIRPPCIKRSDFTVTFSFPV